MNENILFFAIEFAAQTVVLAAALWVMIKFQSLDFNWPGLLGSAALASGLDLIPYFGHYLAVPVLYLCIWKVTRADLFPDAVFTVVIAYALMFCVSMFLLAGLTPDLRPSASATDSGGDEFAQVMSDVAEGQSAGTTNISVGGMQSIPGPGESRTNSQPATDPNAVQAAAAAQAAAAEKAARDKAKTLSLKGVTKGVTRSTAVVHSGVSSYTVVLGETSSMRTPGGVITVRCDEMGDDWVVLNIDGAKVRLVIR